MKVLVLGSEGFIGSNCIKHFKSKIWDVYGCDLIDYTAQEYNYTKLSRIQPSYDELFTGIKYDLCINAAGNGSVPVSIEYPINDFDANCGDVIKLLDLIRLKNSNCKYIHISSAAVYGNPKQIPITENDILLPVSPYGWHKKISETICQEYHSLYHLKISIVRPFSIYGPGLKKQLFWDLYQKIKNDPSELQLWGTGNESRDFIYIADVLNAFDIIADKSPMDANIYNLAGGTEITIGEVATEFLRSFGVNTSLTFNNHQRRGDPINWCADISKIKALGYESKYDISEGLKLTTTWLKGLH